MTLFNLFNDFYRGKRVLVTGHTGFKGSWLSLWLKQLGAEVYGYSLVAPTNPSLFEVIRPGTFASEETADIRVYGALYEAIDSISPDVVFHLAAQPLVRKSYEDPLETFDVNAMGTVHVLEAIRATATNCRLIVVTSDKCYESKEWPYGYRETDQLGGHDVYAMSKAVSELAVQSWFRSFYQGDPLLGPIATVRAGNVIGGGDYAADRIVPDAVRAAMNRQALYVRSPHAVRPWQHVLDCLSGYLWVGANLADKHSVHSFNFGPSSEHPVHELVDELYGILEGQSMVLDNPNNPKETFTLKLCSDKAKRELGWHPVWDFKESVRQSAMWYHARHWSNFADMRVLTLKHLEDYCGYAIKKDLAWTRPVPQALTV